MEAESLLVHGFLCLLSLSTSTTIHIPIKHLGKLHHLPSPLKLSNKSFKNLTHTHSQSEAMDWFSWLSKTSLDPSLVDDYAFLFAHNQLDQDDIQYFNHEFLRSMGISLAKHRLEILKLATKEKGRSTSRNHIFWFVLAIKHARIQCAKRLSTWSTRRSDSGLAALVPLRNYSSRWKASMLKRNNKLTAAKQDAQSILLTNATPKQGSLMMLTNGSPALEIDPSDAWISSSSSSSFEGFRYEEDVDGINGEYSPTADVERIKWDALFQDLKPT